MKNNKLEELLFINFLGELKQENMVEAPMGQRFICYNPYSKHFKSIKKAFYMLPLKDESGNVIQQRQKAYIKLLNLSKITENGCGLKKTEQYLKEYFAKSSKKDQDEFLLNFANNMETLKETSWIQDEDITKILNVASTLILEAKSENKKVC